VVVVKFIQKLTIKKACLLLIVLSCSLLFPCSFVSDSLHSPGQAIVPLVSPPSLNFSSYFGEYGWDVGYSLALARDDSFYVTGYTDSIIFPTKDAFDDTLNGPDDAFLAKFSSNGSLLWSTFLGGNASELGTALAVAADGCCYVAGNTFSDDFPTLKAYNATKGLLRDGFISKFASNGSLLWSTFLGGNWLDYVSDIAVAADGSCYLTGYTESTNFPLKDAVNQSYCDREAFVSKFASNGSLLWSTYLGGSQSEDGRSIALAADGSCVITGWTYSDDFPIIDNYSIPISQNLDVFISQFSPTGTLLWSTIFGGNLLDWGYGIAIDHDNCVFITGNTNSYNFPARHGFSKSFNGGATDAFIAKYSIGGILLWSSYLGGNNTDVAKDLAIASDNSCFVVGYTESTNFPLFCPYDNFFTGDNLEGFISRFSSTGVLLWSSYFGGSDRDILESIAIASDDSFYLTGETRSPDFPVVNAYDATHNGMSDVFLTGFNDDFKTIYTQGTSSSGFLAFWLFLPIITSFIRRKRKKE
jgi:hypothetical protein